MVVTNEALAIRHVGLAMFSLGESKREYVVDDVVGSEEGDDVDAVAMAATTASPSS